MHLQACCVVACAAKRAQPARTLSMQMAPPAIEAYSISPPHLECHNKVGPLLPRQVHIAELAAPQRPPDVKVIQLPRLHHPAAAAVGPAAGAGGLWCWCWLSARGLRALSPPGFAHLLLLLLLLLLWFVLQVPLLLLRLLLLLLPLLHHYCWLLHCGFMLGRTCCGTIGAHSVLVDHVANRLQGHPARCCSAPLKRRLNVPLDTLLKLRFRWALEGVLIFLLERGRVVVVVVRALASWRAARNLPWRPLKCPEPALPASRSRVVVNADRWCQLLGILNTRLRMRCYISEP